MAPMPIQISAQVKMIIITVSNGIHMTSTPALA